MKRSSLLLLWVLCVGVCAGCLREGPNSPDVPPAPTPQPQPVQPDRDHTDAEFWKALGRRVAAGKVESTDEVLGIVKAAKQAGDVQDAERIGAALPNAAAKNEVIDASNRDRIAAAIAGLK